MTQKKMLSLLHHLPDGFPKAYPGTSDKVNSYMPYLATNSGKRWTKIPDHDMEVFSLLKNEVPCVSFKKNSKETYLHIFRNIYSNPVAAIAIVAHLYDKYKYGKPQFAPEEPNWIHTIPLPDADLDPAETLMMYQITLSLFWTINADFKKRKS